VTDVYWPTERREPLQVFKVLEVTLQSVKNELFWYQLKNLFPLYR